jgi:hypothetical protein
LGLGLGLSLSDCMSMHLGDTNLVRLMRMLLRG